ncbi:MAG: ABC transporter permease [Gemmatimonadota bacterium]|nr:ABC transporter permease [Gemmatimonadota bacterium]
MSSRIGGGMGLVSTLTEGIAVAFDSLGSNKVRSALTILGVTIGVLVVMVMAAVITGINSSFTEMISSRGITTFYVAHFDFSSGMGANGPLEEEESDFFKNDPLDPRWARDLGSLPGIESAAAMVDLGSSGYEASWHSAEVEISLYGVSADFLEIDNGDIIDGRWFTQSEADRRANVVVVDSATAFDLFGGLDPLDRHIRIRGGRDATSARVIGVYRPPANLFAGFQTHWVMLPFETANKNLNVWDRQITFVVRPEPQTDLEAAIDVVHARMRGLRGLVPGEEDDFAVMTQDQIVDLWGQLTGALFAVMVGLSSVGLLVGGVGVIGIMMISVTERTREIGLRKSMGARRRDIMWQFLVEAATLTLVGGAAGLLAGGGIVWALERWTPVPASVPIWAIVAALAASAFTGIGFGLYPASRAAALEPVDALRYE